MFVFYLSLYLENRFLSDFIKLENIINYEIKKMYFLNFKCNH